MRQPTTLYIATVAVRRHAPAAVFASRMVDVAMTHNDRTGTLGRLRI
jgi:hypothetical protein